MRTRPILHQGLVMICHCSGICFDSALTGGQQELGRGQGSVRVKQEESNERVADRRIAVDVQLADCSSCEQPISQERQFFQRFVNKNSRGRRLQRPCRHGFVLASGALECGSSAVQDVLIKTFCLSAHFTHIISTLRYPSVMGHHNIRHCVSQVILVKAPQRVCHRFGLV
jgi:hypothetical protein